MSGEIVSNRWSVKGSEFAVRVMIPDLKGFFGGSGLLSSVPRGRSLVIEPGTRALVIDDGVLIGEVPPGDYTLENFVERLQFWRNKQATIFLTRSEEVRLDCAFLQMPCLDGVCFDIHCQLIVQMSDVIFFMQNLMGAQSSLSLTQLSNTLEPLFRSSVQQIIGTMTCEAVRNADLSSQLLERLRETAGIRIQRYGLVLVDVLSLSVRGDDDRLQERRGEIALAARENQLQHAAGQVENQELHVRLQDMQAKVPVRKALRDVVNSDQLAKIQSRDDLEKAVSEIDKSRLLRKEERAQLLTTFEESRADRSALRDHLLATLDLQREQELEELRVNLDYAVRVRALEKETELARQTRTAESEEWQAELQREKDQAAHRRDDKLASVQAAMQRAREARRQSRDDSWESVLHEQRLDGVRGDLELARADRKQRLAIMQSELNTRLQNEKLEMQKRQQEWELELKQRQAGNKLDQLQRLQEMNAQFAERQQRLQLEMETLKADSNSKRELDRIQVMSGLSTEALIATAGSANASLLADLKKHEATQDAVKVQATANPSAQLNEERLKMYEKMNESERAKADAIAEAYKMAMQAQQSSVGQMIGGLAQATSSVHAHHGMPSATMPPSAWGGPPPMPVAETWYVSLNGQQSPPLQLVQVQQYVQSGHVHSGTMVWKTGMPSWLPASQVPQLANLFASVPSPPPTPPGPPPA